MAVATLPSGDLQSRLLAQGLTCQLLTPPNSRQKIARVILHQAGPGTGYTEETAHLYKDILAEGGTAVLLYSPLSGRFGTEGVVEEMSLIVQGVQAVYGNIDLGVVATSGGQKVVLKAAAMDVFGDQLKECVFINGILTSDWAKFNSTEEAKLNTQHGIVRKPKGIQTTPPIIACPARREMGAMGFAKMAFYNFLGRSVEYFSGGYAFLNRLFYLSHGAPGLNENKNLRFLERHTDQEVYNILRRQYPINAGVFSLVTSLYQEDLSEALRDSAAKGVHFFVVRGEMDGTVNDHQHQRVVEIINETKGNLQLLSIPGCSHLVEIEKPDLLREELGHFFRRVLVTSTPGPQGNDLNQEPLVE
ncbi:MAG: hypothetical protein IPJ69_05525 [Deltaproteobacteria bacterium]|nr:MAG: hypothetical protein IPJ69_05525 [Deltaproteobacteria bacterium]